MERESKLKKNVTTGFAGAGGAALGAAAAMVFPEKANADDLQEPSLEEHIGPGTIKAKHQTYPSDNSHTRSEAVLPDEEIEEPNPTILAEPTGVIEPEPTPSLEPIVPGYPGGEVEVLDYQRVTLADGTSMDYADVLVAGDEIRVIDVDQDGIADLMAHDANYNGIIEESEIIEIGGANIEMEPFQEAAGFDNYLAHEPAVEPGPYLPEPILTNEDPDFSAAQYPAYPTDLPDYVNDADIDSFMA